MLSKTFLNKCLLWVTRNSGLNVVDSRKPSKFLFVCFCCCLFKLNDYRSAFRWDGLDGTMIVNRPGHQEES